MTPEYSHPSITAHCIGDAPLYSGSNDACTFTHPKRGISIILFGSSCPKATTTNISALYVLSFSINSSFLAFSGCSTSIPSFTASCLTGENTSSLLLPFGLSGCVTTAATSCPASTSALSVPTAKSGVPINITFTILHPPFQYQAAFPQPYQHTLFHQDDLSHGADILQEVLHLQQ